MNNAGQDNNRVQEQPPIEFESPGVFTIHNPLSRSQPSAAPAFSQALQDRADIREHCLQLLSRAKRTIRIYSTDFEPWLYSQPEVVEYCKNFLLSSEHNRLLVLLHDSKRLLNEGHRLMPLLERLSSRTALRLVSQEHEIFPGCWLGIDDSGLLLRKTSSPHQGLIHYNQPQRVRPYQEQFDAMWSVAHADINLRRMTL